MNKKNAVQPVIVQNPQDGKYYNLAPLFSFINGTQETFETVAGDIEKATQMLPFLVENDEWPPLDIKNATATLNLLKAAFLGVRVVE